MGDFEFYFSFYGLLLGLSVAQVAKGFLDSIDARQAVRIGWLTPIFAIFIFMDISSFWIFAWGIRESLIVGWGTMFGGLFVALAYYFSAGLVFPRKIAEWPDLTEHYWRQKRLVMAGIIVANVVIFGQTLSVRAPEYDFEFWFGQLTYWPWLVVLLISRNTKVDFTALAVLILGYLSMIILPGASFATGG